MFLFSKILKDVPFLKDSQRWSFSQRCSFRFHLLVRGITYSFLTSSSSFFHLQLHASTILIQVDVEEWLCCCRWGRMSPPRVREFYYCYSLTVCVLLLVSSEGSFSSLIVVVVTPHLTLRLVFFTLTSEKDGVIWSGGQSQRGWRDDKTMDSMIKQWISSTWGKKVGKKYRNENLVFSGLDLDLLWMLSLRECCWSLSFCNSSLLFPDDL